jgi:hypothetical protein
MPSSVLDPDALGAARAGLFREPDFLPPEDDLDRPRASPAGSVWVGELLAIFPGLLVHGMGHYYAGDHQTAKRLRHIGEFGYVLTAVGGGMGVGAYYLDQEDLNGFAYTLYGTGGVLVIAGITYIFTAWIYDMIDTPRAVRSGGEPPPRTPFIDSLDLFD